MGFMQIKRNKWVLFLPLFSHFKSLHFPGRSYKYFLDVTGASVETNPLSLKTHGKEEKRDQELGEKTVCPALMMILQKWEGKKKKMKL